MVPLILLNIALNHYCSPVDKVFMGTNKVIFSKVMTWRKTAVNTFNLQSINGPCFLFWPVFSLSASLCLCSFHSSLHLFLYSQLLLQLYSYIIVSLHLPTFFHSINIEHILVWITAIWPYLPPSPCFIFPSLSPTCHMFQLIMIWSNRKAIINQNSLLSLSAFLPYIGVLLRI